MKQFVKPTNRLTTKYSKIFAENSIANGGGVSREVYNKNCQEIAFEVAALPSTEGWTQEEILSTTDAISDIAMYGLEFVQEVRPTDLETYGLAEFAAIPREEVINQLRDSHSRLGTKHLLDLGHLVVDDALVHLRNTYFGIECKLDGPDVVLFCDGIYLDFLRNHND